MSSEDEKDTAAPETERCPVHGIPDCSPLLNGCSRLTSVGAERCDERALHVDLLAMARHILAETYYPKGVETVLTSPNRALAGDSPIGVLVEAQKFFDWAESLTGMVAT